MNQWCFVLYRVVYASYGLRPPSGMRSSIYSDIIIIIIIIIIITIIIVIIIIVVVVVAVAVVADLPALASLHP